MKGFLINRLRVGVIGEYPVVMAVSGEMVWIYNAEHPFRYPPLGMKVTDEAWSCDSTIGLMDSRHVSCITHEYLVNSLRLRKTSDTRLAVGTNSHKVFIMDVSTINEKWNHWDCSGYSSDNQAPAEIIVVTPLVELVHAHNIPCVSISGCGRYCAIASVDSSVAIHNIDGEIIASAITNSWYVY